MCVLNLYIDLYDYKSHKHSCITCTAVILDVYKCLASMQDQGTIMI